MDMPRPRHDDRWRVVARRLRLLLVLVATPGNLSTRRSSCRQAGYEASQTRRPGQSEAQRLASRKRLLTDDLQPVQAARSGANP